ncbi:hypothetical protein L7F22_041657 [Adiantum nelumboides]|nr:hypothetical protein [Adiantum nelumboides]
MSCGKIRVSISCSAGSEENAILDKHDRYDELQALILSAPYPSKGKSVNSASQAPTLLEKEALAMEGFASELSRRQQSEAVNELLDLLENKGVPPGYAFEFLRHATGLIIDLVSLASRTDDSAVASSINGSSSPVHRDKATLNLEGSLKPNLPGSLPLQYISSRLRLKCSHVHKIDGSLASRISCLAEQAGIPRLVYYFYMLNVKAFDIPRLLPYVGQSIDTVMAKVEFLRTLGVKASYLPSVLARWPQLFQYECDQLAVVEEFLKGLGLSQKEIGVLVQKHPEILGQDVEKDLRLTVDFLEDLGVPLESVKKLITRYPFLILEGAEKRLSPLICYLESIGVKQKHMGALLVRRPMLVASNVKKDLWPVGDYLKKLHATADDIDKIITSFPCLFRYNLGQDFQPAVSHLESLGVDPILMGKLFRRHPQLLKNRLNFESKTSFLVNLGLEKKDLGKVIYNAPQLLGLSMDDKVQPAIQFLESLGITRSSLLKVIKRKPMILAHSIEMKLRPNTQFLEGLGINCDDIAKLVTRHPQLLTLSVEKNLVPTVAYLMQLSFNREEVASMVRKLPSLLGFSVVTVLQPKYSYLVEIMQRSPKELVKFPQFFSYSLEKRIIPRHQVLGDACHLHSLSSIYGCSDSEFEKKMYRWKLVCGGKVA